MRVGLRALSRAASVRQMMASLVISGLRSCPLLGAFVSTVPNADFEFDDESVDSIEIGGKHEFLDGAMRLNWAAFYSEYEDLQTTIFKGVGFSVKNAASSEVQGFEVDWLLAGH